MERSMGRIEMLREIMHTYLETVSEDEDVVSTPEKTKEEGN
jgi:hypothetical protein